MSTYSSEPGSVAFVAIAPARGRPQGRAQPQTSSSASSQRATGRPDTSPFTATLQSLPTYQPAAANGAGLPYTPQPVMYGGAYGAALSPGGRNPPPRTHAYADPNNHPRPPFQFAQNTLAPPPPPPPRVPARLREPRFQHPYTNMPPPPSSQAISAPQLSPTPTRWTLEQTPVKGYNLNGTYEEPSVLSGMTPAGLSNSRVREPRQGASFRGDNSSIHITGGGSPSGLFSPRQAYAGVALEKDLLQARKDELVQMLLELASCDAAASSFIRTKARFFAFRRDVGQDSSLCGDDRAGAASAAQSHHRSPHTHGAPALGEAANQHASLEDSLGQHTDRFAALVPRGKTTQGTPTPNLNRLSAHRRHLHDSVDVASAIHTSSQHDSDTHGETSRLLFSAADSPAAATTVAEADETHSTALSVLSDKPSCRPSPVRHCSVKRGCLLSRTGPENRPFVTEFHPCLRWYGTCRNPTSCVYVAVPQNLCLNWVRGACAAEAQCSGAHRLPESCPPEVKRIFDLCHGAIDRCGMPSEARVSAPPATRIPATTGTEAWVSSTHGSASRPTTRSPDPSPHSRGSHTPLRQARFQSLDMAPSVLLAQNTARPPEEPEADCPHEAVVTASPSRVPSCREDTLDALLEGGLRPSIQTVPRCGDEADAGEGGAPPVFRCLNDSFARAAEQTSGSSNTSA